MIPLKDTEQVELTAQALDAKGLPAPVENAVWASSDVEVASVEADASDPLKAVVKAENKLGSARITLNADARIGDGEVPISGFLDVEVTGGEAVEFAIAAGTPTPQ